MSDAAILSELGRVAASEWPNVYQFAQGSLRLSNIAACATFSPSPSPNAGLKACAPFQEMRSLQTGPLIYWHWSGFWLNCIMPGELTEKSRSVVKLWETEACLYLDNRSGLLKKTNFC